MAKSTVFVPMGYSLQIVTDAYTSGIYTRLGNPGGTRYTPTAVAASADTTIGPFNEPREYEFDVSTIGGVTTTLSFSGMNTSSDEDAIALLAPKASPTFTGTVALPSTTSIGDVSSTEIGYLNNVSSAIQTQIDTKRQDANVLSNYASDGAIAFTLNDQYARLSKGEAGAYTLAAPTAGAHDGKTLHIFSSSDFAHVVTCTDGVHDGVTGGAKDTLTFAAFAGASVKLFAYNGHWYVMSNNNVTIAGA